jgi:hypothetical protein
MTTPPDFGGTEIEEGVQEDLGLPHSTPAPSAPDELTAEPDDDNEAQAPGEICGRCGAAIEPGQTARRRADGQWIHEVCPATVL